MVDEVKIYKLNKLPSSVESNALYFIKSGSKFEFYCSDKDGTHLIGLDLKPKIVITFFEELANKLKREYTAVFTYSSGVLRKITYTRENEEVIKNFHYSNSLLTKISIEYKGTVFNKMFSYNSDKSLREVTYGNNTL